MLKGSFLVVLELAAQTQKLDEFYYSNFKLDENWVQWFVILRNANSMKPEILNI